MSKATMPGGPPMATRGVPKTHTVKTAESIANLTQVGTMLGARRTVFQPLF